MKNAYFCVLFLAFILFPINALSNHFITPIKTSISCDYFVHMAVHELPAEQMDEIAFFDPQGNICGLFRFKKQQDGIIVHVYGDNLSTLLDEGAETNDELSIRIWDHSASTEYEHYNLSIAPISPDSQFFSPGSVPPIWQSEKGFAISVDIKAYYQVQHLSPLVCTYIGQINLLNKPAPPGTEIGVFDPDGILCGAFRVTTAGQYGMLHVYGDNPDTQIDEGAEEFDPLEFRIKDHQNQLEIDASSIIVLSGETMGSFVPGEIPPIWRNLTGYHLNLIHSDDSTHFPIAQMKTVNGLEDQALNLNLTAIDPDNGPINYEIITGPEHGQLIQIDKDKGECRYTPKPNYFGIDTFWFIAENAIGVTDTARVTIQIENINDPPCAIAISPLTAYEGIPIHMDASQSSDIETHDVTYHWMLPDLPGIQLDNPLVMTPILTPPELASPQTIFITLTVSDDGGLTDTSAVELLIIPKHTIHVMAGENGTISPSGKIQVYHGDTIAFDIFPDDNYRIDQLNLNDRPQPLSDHFFELDNIQTDQVMDVWFTHINQAPVASFEIENSHGSVPLNVQFIDQSLNTELWFWEFGDGATSIKQNPMHLYTSAGTYSVTLTVFNSGGIDQHIKPQSIQVNLETLSVDYTSTGQQGVIPYTVTFYPQITGEVDRWQWDFGDGTISYDFQPTHVYNTIGQYTVTLSLWRMTETVKKSNPNWIQTTGHRILGQVTDADNGDGLAGCRIDVSLMDDYITSAQTNEQGDYTIDNLKPSSRYILSAWPPDTQYVYQFYNQKQYAFEATYVATGIPGQRINFSMQAAPKAWISGTVTDGSAPLSNVQVDIFSELLGVSRSQTTQSNGSYTFNGLEIAEDYRVSVYALEKQFFYAMQDGGTVGVDLPQQSVFIASQATWITPSNNGLRNINIIVNPIQGAFIAGTVKNDKGEPMSQIHVNAWSDMLNVGGSAFSDSSGHYTITGLTPVLSEEASKSGYYVVIQPENFMVQVYDQVMNQANATLVGTDRKDIDFQLITQGSISGSVLETSGMPISGASIQAWSLSDMSGQLYHTESDPDGKFQLNLPVASDYMLSMKYEGYAIQYFNQQTRSDLAETIGLQYGDITHIRFLLDKGPVIQGYIYEQDFGQPSTDSIVVIESQNLGTIQTIQADSSGFFQFSGLDINVSDYVISVLTDGYLPAYYHDNRDDNLENDTVFESTLAVGVGASAEDGATDRFLTVKQGITVAGEVMDNHSIVIENAMIEFNSDEGIWKTASSNESDINYTITGLLPGTYDIKVSAENYLTYEDQLQLTDDQTLSITMIPEPRLSINGTVHDLKSGTKVDLIVWSETRDIYQTQSIVGNDDGIAYSVNNLPPAEDYIVWVDSQEYADQYYPETFRQEDAGLIILADQDVDHIDFVMTSNLTYISGNLKFEVPPVSGDTVRLEARSHSTGGFGFVQLTLSSASEAVYSITGLLPSLDYIVYLQAPSYQSRYWDGSATGSLSLDLAKPVAAPGQADFMIFEGFQISGTVTDSHGSPMNVLVEIGSQSTQIQKVTQTNDLGQYVVNGLLKAKDFQLKVTTNKNGVYYYHPLGAVRQVTRSQLISTNDGDQKGIDLILVTGEQIEGIIQTLTGQRIQGVWVSAWSDSQNVGGGVFSDEMGRYAISDLPQWHDYVVTVEPSWDMPYERSQQRLISVPSDNINFILRHKQGMQISGIVRDPSGKPVHKATVSMQNVNQNKRPPAWTITDAKGQYIINLLSPFQTYKLEIIPPNNKDWAIENRSIYMNANQTADIMLSPGYVVSGVVIDGLENPVANAQVTLFSESIQFAGETTSKTNGKFEMNHVPMASDYILTIKAKGFLDKKETHQKPVRNMIIQMNNSGQISGIVRSLITGAPINNATIEIYSQANQAMADYKGVVSTNDQGEFVFTGFNPMDRNGQWITDLVVTAYANGFPPMSQTGRKPNDTVAFNLIKSTKNELSGSVLNSDANMVVIDIFSVNHAFVKSVSIQGADFIINGLRPNQGYILKFIALTHTGSVHAEWAGENDLGTKDQNLARIYTAPDQIAFEFSFLNSPEKRSYKRVLGPGPVQNLRSLSHKYFSTHGRKRNIDNGNNMLSNNPNVVVTWDAPLENRENLVGYYSRFDTMQEDINKFNISSRPPIRTRKITSRDLSGDDVQYYFHVAAVDKDGRIGQTQSIAFRIDTIPPGNVQVIAPEICSTRNISLILGATGATEIYISNISYHEGGQWENISNKKTWQITDGAGIKNIYARFRDRAGNTSQAAEITKLQPTLPTYLIKAFSDDHGSIIPSGNIVVDQGDSLTFTIKPDAQYTIAELIVNNRIKSITNNTLTLTDIQKAYEIHVSFKQENLPPIAVSKSIYGKEDARLDGQLDGIDPNNDPLTYEIIQPPVSGEIIKQSGGLFTYQPASNQHGLFFLQFTVSDNKIVSEPGQITLVIEGVNDPPQAIGKRVETEIDTPVEMVLAGTDIDNDHLIFSVDKQSLHGKVTIHGQKAIFTPNPGFNDLTEFTFRVFDGKLYSNPARVEIWVGLPPVDTVLTEDQPVAINIPADAQMLTLPIKGIYANGMYSPIENATGHDVLYFQVNGQILNHSLFIKPVNDPPVITTQNVTIKEDQSIKILLTATDIENDHISFSIAKEPQQGGLIQNLPQITYTPDKDFYGLDQLVIQASDGMHSITKNLAISIQAVNDPPIAKDQEISKLPIVIPVSFTLEAIDMDIDDNLSYTFVSYPQTGILSGGDANWTYTQDHWGMYEFQFIVSDGQASSNTGTVKLYLDMPIVDAFTLEDKDLDLSGYLNQIEGNQTVELSKSPDHGHMLTHTEKGIWGYRPEPDYFGADTFELIVDAKKYQLNVYVYPVNDPPVINILDPLITIEDDAFSFDYHISDSDSPSELLKVTPMTCENGQLSKSSEKAFSLTYEPDRNFYGDDICGVKIDDNECANDVVLQIKVHPVNDPPVAISQQIRMLEDTSKLIILQGKDIENMPLEFICLTNPLFGSLTGTIPNLIYTPQKNSLASDSFQFIVNDGELTSTIETVTIVIQNVNDPPQANGNEFTLDYPEPLIGELDASDCDPDILIYSLVDYPKMGEIIINAVTGQFIYHAPEIPGDDYFSFKVNDGYMDSNTATVLIHVNTPSAPSAALQLSLTTPYIPGDGYRIMLFDTRSQMVRDTIANTANVKVLLPDKHFYRLLILSEKYEYFEYPEMVMPQDLPISITLRPLSEPRQKYSMPEISQTLVDGGFYLNITSSDTTVNDIRILNPVNPEGQGFSQIMPSSPKNKRKIFQWQVQTGQYSSMQTSASGCTYYTLDIKLNGKIDNATFSVNYVTCEEVQDHKSLMHRKFETTYGPTQTHTINKKVFYPMEGTDIRLNIKDNNETLPIIIPPIPLEFLFLDIDNNLNYDPETDWYDILDPKHQLNTETPLMAKISYYTFDKHAPGSAVDVSFFVASGPYNGCPVRYNPVVNNSNARYDEVIKNKAPSLLIPLVLNKESSDYSACYHELIEHQQVKLYIDEKGDGQEGFRGHTISSSLMDDRSDIVLLSVDHLTGIGFAKEETIVIQNADEGSGGCFIWGVCTGWGKNDSKR